MANTNGSNAALLALSKKAAVGEVNGHVKTIFDTIVFASAVVAVNDTFKIGAPLPKGARVLDVKVKCPSLGTTGIFDIGYLANGVDAADPDAFAVGLDAGGQAVLGGPTLAAAGIHKKFTAETQVSGIFTEATTTAAASTTTTPLSVAISYIVD
jgi:hypothetical protein